MMVTPGVVSLVGMSSGIDWQLVFTKMHPEDAPCVMRGWRACVCLGCRCDVLVASDAIGMGLNLAIQRVIFSSMSKYDGERWRCSHSVCRTAL